MTSPRKLIALAALAGLALAACGSDGPDASGSPDDTLEPVDPGSTDDGGGSVPTADELGNRAFESTSVEGHELVEGTTINLMFEADLIAVRAGCNGMSGGFTFDEDALVVQQMAMTMMACDQPLMDQDTWVQEFLTSLPKIALDGETLTLTGTDATITFAEVADAELEGTTWNVTGTVENEGVSSVPEGASLTFADGTVNVNAGCNTGSGGVVITDTTITFEPIATTRMACEDDLMALEASVLAVLDGDVDYEIHGDSLLLTNSDGLGLQLTAA